VNVLVVFAHPEPRSFGRALLDRGVAELERAGHDVVVSDLYAMGFNPIASADDFAQRRFPDALHYDREQKYAVQHGGIADDIAAEVEKLVACELLILQFPLWWFSVPAILKGWIDRVFRNGVAYGSGSFEQPPGLGVPVVIGPPRRGRVVMAVAHGGVGAVAEQQPDELEVAVRGGRVQRRDAGRRVDVPPQVDQHRRGGDAVLLGRADELVGAARPRAVDQVGVRRRALAAHGR
jgi:putative NADPH-quinone reductase